MIVGLKPSRAVVWDNRNERNLIFWFWTHTQVMQSQPNSSVFCDLIEPLIKDSEIDSDISGLKCDPLAVDTDMGSIPNGAIFPI